MIEFLIKSSVAMGALLCLYYILFEREKMHRFNRFYLLSALVFSLALPFITVITYIKEIKVSTEPIVSITSQPIVKSAPSEPTTDYLFYIGVGLYILVTFILTIRFIKNISPFIKKASSNPVVKMGAARLILLEEKVLPHTFLNYVFVNREEHEARMIEEELYTHELTHVRQKHTIDILFIEALKTIFWFNPLLYFYKKAIQLNHEFLADEKVIDTTANTIYYQNLLLEKASVGTTFSMASNLNFSLTKKRLLMMTKTTSIVKAGSLKIAIAPVVAALMMLLCTETVAQETNKTSGNNEQSMTASNLVATGKMSEAERLERLESMRVTDAQFDSLKRANPDDYSDDLAIRYRNTIFRFIDKKGKVTEKKGYKGLTKKEKKLVDLSADSFYEGGGGMMTFGRAFDIDPKFPGGYNEFIKFINSNINLPATEKDMTFKLNYNFVIDADGKLSDPKLYNKFSANENTETLQIVQKEVMKALLMSPKWLPALKAGKPVRSSMDTPFTINLKAKP